MTPTRAATEEAVARLLSDVPARAAVIEARTGLPRLAVRELLRSLEADGRAVVAQGEGWVAGPNAQSS